MRRRYDLGHADSHFVCTREGRRCRPQKLNADILVGEVQVEQPEGQSDIPPRVNVRTLSYPSLGFKLRKGLLVSSFAPRL